MEKNPYRTKREALAEMKRQGYEPDPGWRDYFDGSVTEECVRDFDVLQWQMANEGIYTIGGDCFDEGFKDSVEEGGKYSLANLYALLANDIRTGDADMLDIALAEFVEENRDDGSKEALAENAKAKRRVKEILLGVEAFGTKWGVKVQKRMEDAQ